MAATAPAVYLAGEAPLVRELGAGFRSAGFRVLYRLNGRAPLKPAGGFVRAPRPPRSVAAAFELTVADREQKRRNLLLMERALPASTVICSGSVAITAGEQATWLRHPGRLLGICALPTLLSRPLLELAPTRQTLPAAAAAAKALLGRIGKETAVVQDRIGMVMPRILCMLVNEAAFALTENTASAEDIDTAMKLGTNYPLGPIEWADRIGVVNVVAILKSLNDDLREERYRIAPVLSQLATGERWWNT
jgi:3-hydroxybutyryl-CoA dehydrogenase